MENISFLKKFNSIILFIIFFVILPSPIPSALIGHQVNDIFKIISFCVILYILFKNSRYMYEKQINIKVVCFIMLLALVASFFSHSISQLMLGITLLFFIVISNIVVRSGVLQKSVNFAFYFTVALLVAAWIGAFYSFIGGESQFCFDNPDGRENCLYLTTFTNTGIMSGLIRPAGIFDEPGALSFFTILIVCFNEMYGGSKIKSWTMLLLGLVTLSVAHIICLIAYSTIVFRKHIIYLILFCALIGGLFKVYVSEDSILYMTFFNRFEVNEDGKFAGDNRSNQIEEFFSLVNSNISQYGQNVIDKNIGGEADEDIDQTSNPFTTWYQYGFVMWIPYVITMIIIFYHIFSRRKSVQITSVLLIILLLQRPYIYSLAWGFAIWTIITMMLYDKKVA